jgi:GntR family transcriptional repressor for pyruvate dehydrogenase complex
LPALTPVTRHSLSEAVFRQLRDRIVGGEILPGDALPAERELGRLLGVNRSAVREAIKRLEQAHLVAVRHGGASRVLDYRESAGLDLLSDLLVTSDETFDPKVVRSVMEMRSALAPDIARRAALRANAELAARLLVVLHAMEASREDLRALQDHATDFWSALVTGSDNIAYQLAYNSMRETYDRCRELLTQVLARELRAIDAYRTIAAAVTDGDADHAESAARTLVRLGEADVVTALDHYPNGGGTLS